MKKVEIISAIKEKIKEIENMKGEYLSVLEKYNDKISSQRLLPFEFECESSPRSEIRNYYKILKMSPAKLERTKKNELEFLLGELEELVMLCKRKIEVRIWEHETHLKKIKEEKVKFNPENTAIATRYSKSAELVANESKDKKVLDYGCGLGRNIKYIKENSRALQIDGTEIKAQLIKARKNHDKLRELGCVIDSSEKIKDSHYDLILNSHVLNVIESDEVKKSVLKDIYKKLKKGGKAFIEVRTKKDVEGAKSKEKYGDGWKIKKGNSFTYQEGITKEKMRRLLLSAGFTIAHHNCSSTRHIAVVYK